MPAAHAAYDDRSPRERLLALILAEVVRARNDNEAAFRALKPLIENDAQLREALFEEAFDFLLAQEIEKAQARLRRTAPEARRDLIQRAGVTVPVVDLSERRRATAGTSGPAGTAASSSPPRNPPAEMGVWHQSLPYVGVGLYDTTEADVRRALPLARKATQAAQAHVDFLEALWGIVVGAGDKKLGRLISAKALTELWERCYGK